MPAIYPGPIPPVMNALHGAHTFRLQRHASQHCRSWPGYGVHAVGTSSIRRLGGPILATKSSNKVHRGSVPLPAGLTWPVHDSRPGVNRIVSRDNSLPPTHPAA
jgi:hypothetical protein